MEGAGLFYYNSLVQLHVDIKYVFFRSFFPPLFIWYALILRKQRKLVHALCRVSEAICHIFTGTICYDKSYVVHTSWHKVQRGCHGENSTKRIIYACVTKWQWSFEREKNNRDGFPPANLAHTEPSDWNRTRSKNEFSKYWVFVNIQSIFISE